MTPPKLPLLLLRWFCSEERLEELEGDLYEVYQEFIDTKPRTAKIAYTWMVLNSFRFYALKNSKQKTLNKMTHFFLLLKHQTRLVLRQLWKHKTTTAINMVGLAIGLAGFLAIFAIIRYEFSFNKHIPNANNIYRIYTEFTGVFESLNRGVSGKVAPFLKQNSHSDIEMVTAFHTKSLTAKPIKAEEQDPFRRVATAVVDTAFFNVFEQYDWLAGNAKTALKNPFEVVLLKEQSQKYFGETHPLDVIGKEIAYNDSLRLKVSGVITQKSGNTDFTFTDFISFSTIERSWLKNRLNYDDWSSTNSSTQTWIKVKGTVADVNVPTLLGPLNDHVAELDKEEDYHRQFKLQPLSELHFNPDLAIFDNRGRSSANSTTLSILSAVCIALLFMAMFNFINLETAQASSRSKEVGVTKVLGSSRISVFGKFLLESLMITLLATIIALPLAYFSLNWFDSFLPKDAEINLFHSDFLILVILLVFAVGLLSGIYPALRISSINVSRALKSNAIMSFAEKGAPMVRKVLVSTQFVCSQVLIIAAITVFFQVRYLINKDLGFKDDNVMYIYTSWRHPHQKAEVLYQELSKNPQITDLVWQQSTPASQNTSSLTLTHKQDGNERIANVYRKVGSPNYLEFYGIDLLAGRNVMPNDELREIVVNETLIKEFGMASPSEALGNKLVSEWTFKGETNIDNYLIVGVMKDFHNLTLQSKIKPTLFEYDEESNEIAFKALPENTKEVIESVTSSYRGIYPDEAAEIQFMDETIYQFYEGEQRISKLAAVTTFLAMLISSLGLFGLISITILQRTKEVGIRKILGADVWAIGKIISLEFLWLLLIAFVVTIPLAQWLTKDWLAEFAYQAPIGWWTYALGGLLSILIAFLTVVGKLYKAARANPVDALRYE